MLQQPHREHQPRPLSCLPRHRHHFGIRLIPRNLSHSAQVAQGWASVTVAAGLAVAVREVTKVMVVKVPKQRWWK